MAIYLQVDGVWLPPTGPLFEADRNPGVHSMNFGLTVPGPIGASDVRLIAAFTPLGGGPPQWS